MVMTASVLFIGAVPTTILSCLGSADLRGEDGCLTVPWCVWDIGVVKRARPRAKKASNGGGSRQPWNWNSDQRRTTRSGVAASLAKANCRILPMRSVDLGFEPLNLLGWQILNSVGYSGINGLKLWKLFEWSGHNRCNCLLTMKRDLP